MNDEIILETDGSEELPKDEALGVSGKYEKLKKELEEAKSEKQEYLDGWQRAKADYVNALKRFEDEKNVAYEKGKVSVLQSMVPIYDALMRAKDTETFSPGFQNIEKQIESVFTLYQISLFGEVGDLFDPNIHEALGTDEPQENNTEDTVSMVLEKGYMIEGSLLRPAKVRVFQKT